MVFIGFDCSVPKLGIGLKINTALLRFNIHIEGRDNAIFSHWSLAEDVMDGGQYYNITISSLKKGNSIVGMSHRH